MSETEGEGERPAPIATLAGFRADPEPTAEPVAAGLEANSDFQLFVGPNLQRFEAPPGASGLRHLRALGCWAGFFFPQAWFLYRKLYGWAALCCLLPIVAAALNLGGFGRLLVASTSVIGLGGRSIYIAAARRTIARIRAASRDEDDARQTIQRAGGVSIAGAVVGGLIVFGANVTAFLIGVHVLHLSSP
jgi:hypothetical protein